MATLLVGAAATGLGGIGGIGTAATTGLFGSAGAFSLAQTAVTSGIALSAFGQYKQGQAAQAQAQSEQNIANYNAKIQQQEAAAKRTATRFESKRQAESAARTRSALKARTAAAGGIGSPVAIDLAAEQASELELENLLLGFEGETTATRAERQGQIDIASGGLSKQRGKAGKTAADIGIGTTLLTGFA